MSWLGIFCRQIIVRKLGKVPMKISFKYWVCRHDKNICKIFTMSIRGYHWNYLVWDASPGFFICFSSISSLPSKWPPPDLVRLVILDPGTIGMPEDVFPFLMFELSNKEVELVDILSWRWTAKKKSQNYLILKQYILYE